MRDLITRHTERYEEPSFSLPYVQSISVNWPYGDVDTITRRLGSGEVVVHPNFEQHLRNIDNWSLGPAFAQIFPSFNGCYRLGAI